MRISDWSSDVCSSDLRWALDRGIHHHNHAGYRRLGCVRKCGIRDQRHADRAGWRALYQEQERFQFLHAWRHRDRSEEHTSELQSLMRISYAVFCLKKKKTQKNNTDQMKLQQRHFQ